jgi:hypothetical protein
VKGLESSVSEALGRYGLDFAAARYLGMALAGAVVVLAAMVLVGLPVRWVLRPVTWPLKLVLGRRGSAKAA